jgi:hypothetical protein
MRLAPDALRWSLQRRASSVLVDPRAATRVWRRVVVDGIAAQHRAAMTHPGDALAGLRRRG